MGSLFRSEEMTLCQLFIQSEAAYNCMSVLGEEELLQFRDLNTDVNAFQRKFVHEIRRCDELERQLSFIETEIKSENVPLLEPCDDLSAPKHREETELEAIIEKLEHDLKDTIKSAIDLKHTYLELTEMRYVLKKTQEFFNEKPAATTSVRSRKFSQASVYFEMEAMKSFLTEFGQESAKQNSSCDLEFVTGVNSREKMMPFEVMLWRVSRGNVFMRQAEIELPLEDPKTGEQVQKVVFIIFFQGEHLRTKIVKICEGFRATLYPCPETDPERREMLGGVVARLEDLDTVLHETSSLKTHVLVAAAKNLQTWQVKARKMKAIYYSLNMLDWHVTQKSFIGEAWCALADMSKARAALAKASEMSGSSVPSIINQVTTHETPPTFNRLNKFTAGFQAIVDAYGVASYQEVNPAPYTIITFPFLFALMFGDAGHGLLVALFGAFLIYKEKEMMAKKIDNEIVATFFGGRYIILLMGIFSVYTGFIYNDIFAKGMNIFGSSWRATNTTELFDHVNLDPAVNYVGLPYTFGVDPIWMTAGNRILFLNSYKMKLSVILGVVQMLFGVFLSCLNHSYFNKPMNIMCEFIPQVLFLVVIFGYMDALIVYKWTFYTSAESGCAPSVLIVLINMFMVKYPDEPCNLAPMYAGQKPLQIALVLIAVVCIPWMLIIKPCLINRQRKSKKNYRIRYRPSSAQSNESRGLTNEEVSVDVISDGSTAAANAPEPHAKEESMADIVIHQCIHTIEYCLGSISHTASYLRLWALSLAHGQLSEVLWNMVMRIGLTMTGIQGGFILYAIFAIWACLTVAILLLMEGLSSFLHALRLHWVEFQSKFYSGTGYAFQPFSFKTLLHDAQDD